MFHSQNRVVRCGAAFVSPCRSSAARPVGEPNVEAVRLAAHVRRRELVLTLKEVVGRAGVAASTVTGGLYGYHEGSARTARYHPCT
jgi:hypothetical protein